MDLSALEGLKACFFFEENLRSRFNCDRCADNFNYGSFLRLLNPVGSVGTKRPVAFDVFIDHNSRHYCR